MLRPLPLQSIGFGIQFMDAMDGRFGRTPSAPPVMDRSNQTICFELKRRLTLKYLTFSDRFESRENVSHIDYSVGREAEPSNQVIQSDDQIIIYYK